MSTRITAKDLLCLDANALANINQNNPTLSDVRRRLSITQSRLPGLRNFAEQFLTPLQIRRAKVEELKNEARELSIQNPTFNQDDPKYVDFLNRVDILIGEALSEGDEMEGLSGPFFGDISKCLDRMENEINFAEAQVSKNKFRTVLRNFNSQEQGKIIEAVNFYVACKNYLEPSLKNSQKITKSTNEGIDARKQEIKDLSDELKSLSLETEEGKAAFETLRQKAKNMYDNLKKVEQENLSPFMDAMAQTKNMAEEGIAMADPFIRDLNSINNARIQRSHALFLEGFGF